MDLTFGLDKDSFTLPTSQIKILAVAIMVIDHIGIAFYPDVYILRIIGRMAFPLFVFFVVQGYFYTSNFNKYAIRLLVLALVSEIPFDNFTYGDIFNMEGQNVCFSLFLVLYFVRTFDNIKKVLPRIIIVLVFCLLGFLLKVDYLWLGILYALVFYFRIKYNLAFLFQMMMLTIFSFTFVHLLIVQPFAPLVLLPMALYQPKKVDKPNLIINLFNRNKKYYYWFYPVQYVIINLITYAIQ
jgi:hypothetical protein